MILSELGGNKCAVQVTRLLILCRHMVSTNRPWTHEMWKSCSLEVEKAQKLKP